jgi:hypothetical protein
MGKIKSKHHIQVMIEIDRYEDFCKIENIIIGYNDSPYPSNGNTIKAIAWALLRGGDKLDHQDNINNLLSELNISGSDEQKPNQ